MTSQPPAIIECALCGVPHRAGAVTCDGCGHPLDERPDYDEMRFQYARCKRDMALAAAAIAGMITLNAVLFGGAGYVIATAPLGWFGWSWLRFRALKKALERHR